MKCISVSYRQKGWQLSSAANTLVLIYTYFTMYFNPYIVVSFPNTNAKATISRPTTGKTDHEAVPQLTQSIYLSIAHKNKDHAAMTNVLCVGPNFDLQFK